MGARTNVSWHYNAGPFTVVQIKIGLQTIVGLYLRRRLTHGFGAMCMANYPSMGHAVFAHLFSKWRRGLAGCRQFYSFMRFRYHNAAGWSSSLVVGEHDNLVAESSVAASVLLNKNSNIAMRFQECHVLYQMAVLINESNIPTGSCFCVNNERLFVRQKYKRRTIDVYTANIADSSCAHNSGSAYFFQ